jgi:DNA polymerase III psi subunit
MINNHSLAQLGLQPMQLNARFRKSETDEQRNENALVFIGAELSVIWENEGQAEWQLLQNILKSFKLDVENVVCFDSNLLQTDETIQLTIEEIIEIGCEQVFSFDEDSDVIAELQEGLQVAFLPDLSEQLVSWQAKKVCFEIMRDLCINGCTN